jgi:hypothetical protein
MCCKSTFVAGALLMLAAASSPGSAVTVGPHSVAPVAEDSLVQLAQIPYCRRVRLECATQWGLNTRRFYICAQRRGCFLRAAEA